MVMITQVSVKQCSSCYYNGCVLYVVLFCMQKGLKLSHFVTKMSGYSWDHYDVSVDFAKKT